MAKREFLMLAKEHKMEKYGPCYGYYASEKLDGMRGFWDGGLSRGIPASEVPFANTRKHDRYLRPPVATGLWSRYGQPIQAPSWWLDELPKVPLDGELWAGRGEYQTVTSTCRRLNADAEWKQIKFVAFDSPPLEAVFAHGAINNKFVKQDFGTGTLLWASLKMRGILAGRCQPETPYYTALSFIRQFPENDVFEILDQHPVPNGREEAEKFLDHMLNGIESAGGEGLMLRSPISHWKPERTDDLLKVKRLHDIDGVVMGYKWARPTDMDGSITGNKTDKLIGLMGSVMVELDSGVGFDLGVGFTESERVISHIHGEDDLERVKAVGQLHAGEEISPLYSNPTIPRGTRITITYRELTKDGCPKEARYKRPKED